MGRRIAAKALIIVALYLNFTGVCASPAPAESGSFNFLWENDAIAGTDHHCTNGVEVWPREAGYPRPSRSARRTARLVTVSQVKVFGEIHLTGPMVENGLAFRCKLTAATPAVAFRPES
jgi:hypothetical protein